MQSYHTSVLKDECFSFVKRFDVRRLVDCNLGEGGHAKYFLENKPDLFITGIDCDAGIMDRAKENLCEQDGRICFLNSWADAALAEMPDESEGCVFFDLGISMYHYKGSDRGFGFSKDERLDMRLCESDSLTAYDVVNGYSEKDLAKIIFEYSDERKSRRIAAKIVEERKKGRICTSKQLAETVRTAFSPFEIRKSGIDVATKTFQAIRIEVNNELGRLKSELDCALRVIGKGGIVMVISFHSLEDRIVKYRFRQAAADGCYEIITKKPLTASDAELESNPASRSAKLRVIRRTI